MILICYLELSSRIQEKKTLTMIKDRDFFTLIDKVLYFKLFKELLRPHLYEVLYIIPAESTLTSVYYEKNVDPFAVSVSL